MHSILTVSLGDAATEPADSYAWTMKPSRKRLLKRLAVLVPVVAFASVCATVLFHSLIGGFAAATLLIVAVADQFVPYTFVLDSKGARACIGKFTWLEMPWTAVQSLSCIPEGIKLSPFPNPAIARLESKRGIRLAFRATDADAVTAVIERYRADARDARDAESKR